MQISLCVLGKMKGLAHFRITVGAWIARLAEGTFTQTIRKSEALPNIRCGHLTLLRIAHSDFEDINGASGYCYSHKEVFIS